MDNAKNVKKIIILLIREIMYALILKKILNLNIVSMPIVMKNVETVKKKIMDNK